MIDIDKKIQEVENYSDVTKQWYKDNNIDPLYNVLSITKEINEHKNELVIDGHQVVRLVDCEDGEDDFYWVYEKWAGMYGRVDNNTTYHSSCVGTHIRLKGNISDKDYNEMVRIWNLNNLNKAV